MQNAKHFVLPKLPPPILDLCSPPISRGLDGVVGGGGGGQRPSENPIHSSVSCPSQPLPGGSISKAKKRKMLAAPPHRVSVTRLKKWSNSGFFLRLPGVEGWPEGGTQGEGVEGISKLSSETFSNQGHRKKSSCNEVLQLGTRAILLKLSAGSHF